MTVVRFIWPITAPEKVGFTVPLLIAGIEPVPVATTDAAGVVIEEGLVTALGVPPVAGARGSKKMSRPLRTPTPPAIRTRAMMPMMSHFVAELIPRFAAGD